MFISISLMRYRIFEYTYQPLKKHYERPKN